MLFLCLPEDRPVAQVIVNYNCAACTAAGLASWQQLLPLVPLLLL
jgi:hypothetical protein